MFQFSFCWRCLTNFLLWSAFLLSTDQYTVLTMLTILTYSYLFFLFTKSAGAFWWLLSSFSFLWFFYFAFGYDFWVRYYFARHICWLWRWLFSDVILTKNEQKENEQNASILLLLLLCSSTILRAAQHPESNIVQLAWATQRKRRQASLLVLHFSAAGTHCNVTNE